MRNYSENSVRVVCDIYQDCLTGGNRVRNTDAGTDDLWFTTDDQLSTNTYQLTTAYLFTGRRFDEETGLYYFRARMWDTSQGRFINRDPAEYKDGLNLYAGWFVSALVDPIGALAFWEIVPFFRTYGHLTIHPPGSDWVYYYDSMVSQKQCKCKNEAYRNAVRLNCEKKISTMMNGFLIAYTGMMSFSGAETVTSMALSAQIANKTVANSLEAVLAVEGMADVTAQILQMSDIREAADEAKRRFCDCSMWD